LFKKENDEKKKNKPSFEDQEQIFVIALSVNDHTTYDWIIDSSTT
jgi:hypothetical protein